MFFFMFIDYYLVNHLGSIPGLPTIQIRLTMEQQMIKTSSLEVNKGQIEGLPKNPRFIRDERYKALVKSIEDAPEMLNLRELIVVEHGKKYVVIGGNMRLRACKELGYAEVPCKVLPADTPVAKLREYAIKDNNGFGEDDWDILANEWDSEELEDWGVELPMDWDADGQGDATASEDDFDESEVTEAVCKRGEVWKLGEHRLMCGDSTSEEDFAKLMGEERADMVFTDPPYGVSIGDKNATLNSVQKAGRCCENIANDTMPSDQLYEVLVKAMTNVREFSKDDASYYVTSPQGGELGLMMMMMMRDAGLMVRHMLIWCKNSATFSLGRLDYDYQHEPIFYTWTKSHHNYRGGENRTTIWKYDKPRKCDLHPTMKPVELVANCLKDCTKEGDIVLDAFGGSGTTIIAAEQLNRKCRMMELDPHYCDVIIARWEKLTGQKAERISDG